MHVKKKTRATSIFIKRKKVKKEEKKKTIILHRLHVYTDFAPPPPLSCSAFHADFTCTKRGKTNKKRTPLLKDPLEEKRGGGVTLDHCRRVSLSARTISRKGREKSGHQHIDICVEERSEKESGEERERKREGVTYARACALRCQKQVSNLG